MKICLVMCWGFEKLDGSNMRVYYLLKELLSRKHNVIVLHSSDEQAVYTKNTFGCEAISVGQKIDRWVSVKKKMFNYFNFVRKAKKILPLIDCDIVFGISLINSMAAVSKRNAIKRIMYVDFMSYYFQYGYPEGIKNKLLFKLGNSLEEYTIKKADHVIMITKALRNLICPDLHHKIVIVPDGADTKIFCPKYDGSIIRREYNLESSYVIGYQGGIEPHDGLQFLAQAAPIILKERSNVKFLIAGKGSYLEKIKNLVQKNGTIEHWIFCGWVDFKKIPYFMAATDLNVVPIPDHPATQPVITFRLLESMAAGVSVIASDLPGIREIADETMINFTRPENTNTFAYDIIKVLDMEKNKKEKQTENSRKKIEEMDWRKICEKDADFVEGKIVM